MIRIVANALGMVPKSLEKKNGGIGNQRKNGDYPDDSIVKTGETCDQLDSCKRPTC